MNEKKLNEQLDASWENALAFLKACITGEKPRLRRLVETLEKKSSEIMVSNERLQEENISLKKQLESATNAEKHYKTVSENNKKDLQRIKNEYSDLQALNKLLWNFFQKISVVIENQDECDQNEFIKSISKIFDSYRTLLIEDGYTLIGDYENNPNCFIQHANNTISKHTLKTPAIVNGDKIIVHGVILVPLFETTLLGNGMEHTDSNVLLAGDHV